MTQIIVKMNHNTSSFYCYHKEPQMSEGLKQENIPIKLVQSILYLY